ncbi:MurR/RpiR family transcriptional regulator [Mesobacillus foraminis]|uniref:RpiR family transcriptional regulator n=1 Tax=Mesobacillus foraminis TaxID=279826 RepID=A0A4R2BH76_9BACI|nr:MurR/RpiR family transcriptional regulator [Mesobacillus foraminis]TCN26206.1 RpiR family transcriptional regulator [Mesobacillus foraminis]
MMQFEEQVRKFEYKLSDTEDQIVEYIINHKAEAVTLSIQHLASILYTVPNTITRLSKKLGYDGFSHMKNSLKEELNEINAIPAEDSLVFNIHKTISLIDEEKLANVTKTIQEARRLLFFAVGDTAPYCEVMIKSLKVAGKHGEFYFHRHEMIYEINHLEKIDVLFLISLSGETRQVLEMAELAKQRGVTLISLTHFTKNALQSLTDLNLYCYSPEKRLNEYNVTDKTPVMLVLRALAEYYWEASNSCV